MPEFKYAPKGHSSPAHNLAIGTVELDGVYEVEDEDAIAGLRGDPDFEEVVEGREPTRADLKGLAESLGLQVPSNANKAAIQELIDAKQAEDAAAAAGALAAEQAAAAATADPDADNDNQPVDESAKEN